MPPCVEDPSFPLLCDLLCWLNCCAGAGSPSKCAGKPQAAPGPARPPVAGPSAEPAQQQQPEAAQPAQQEQQHMVWMDDDGSIDALPWDMGSWDSGPSGEPSPHGAQPETAAGEPVGQDVLMTALNRRVSAGGVQQPSAVTQTEPALLQLGRCRLHCCTGALSRGVHWGRPVVPGLLKLMRVARKLFISLRTSNPNHWHPSPTRPPAGSAGGARVARAV